MVRAIEDPQRAAAFSVKNTFIDFDDDITEDSIHNVAAWGRGQTEPASPHFKDSGWSMPSAHAARRSGMGMEVPEPEDEPNGGQGRHAENQSYTFNSMMMPFPDQTGFVFPPMVDFHGQQQHDMHMPKMHQFTPNGAQINVVAMPAMQAQAAGSSNKAPPDWEGTTTVMMRNIPNKYTQNMMLQELNDTGFEDLYDFFYLPMDPETCANKGYAFINFDNSDAAWSFKVIYEGRKMTFYNSTKRVSVTPATLQGFDANYAHYSSSRVSRGDPASRPLFLRRPACSVPTKGRNRPRRGKRNSAIDAAAEEQSPHTTAAVRASGYASRNPAAMSALAAASEAAAAISMARPEKCHEEPEVTIGSSGAKAVAKFCPFCGGSIMQSFRFCQFCGANIETFAGA